VSHPVSITATMVLAPGGDAPSLRRVGVGCTVSLPGGSIRAASGNRDRGCQRRLQEEVGLGVLYSEGGPCSALWPPRPTALWELHDATSYGESSSVMLASFLRLMDLTAFLSCPS